MPLSRNELKRLRSLGTKKGRASEGLFVAEGVRAIEAALQYGSPLTKLYYADDDLNSRGRAVVDRARSNAVSCVEVSARELSQVADTETPQGLITTLPLPSHRLEQTRAECHPNVLVAASITDPGNLGTLIRSALAFEFTAVILAGHGVDPYSPKVVRSTAGAIFALHTVRASEPEALRFVEDHEYLLVASSGSRDAPEKSFAMRSALEPTTRIALAVGTEGDGLSAPFLEKSRYVWRIDHSEKVESLNAAIAGSLLMKAIYDARHGHGTPQH